jgi:photosystem II stability/assembly factor-like uncharacterized protein
MTASDCAAPSLVRTRVRPLVILLALLAGCWATTIPESPRVVERTWKVPASWPHTHSLRAVHGTSLSEIYAVGDRGTVLRSTDRGASWSSIPTRADLYFTGVWVGESGRFAVANHLNPADEVRAVIVQLDHGSARMVRQLDDVQLVAVWGAGPMIAAAGSQVVTEGERTQHLGIVVWSRDRGQTWTATRPGIGEIVAIGGTGSLLHVLARDGTLATSRDGGVTYTLGRLPEGEYEALDVAPGRVLAATAHREIVRSTDDGATWTTVRDYADGHVWSTGQRVLAFHNGLLDHSQDGGSTWTRQSTREIVSAVWGLEGGFVAVGQGGLISTSTDGVVWERRDRGVVGALRDVSGSGEDDVYFVGDDGGRGGVIVHTTDRGNTFSFARGGWPALTGVWSGGRELVLAVGDRGTILRSRSRGAWQVIPSGIDAKLLAVGGCDAREIYTVGEGVIGYSRDQGATWQPIVLDEPMRLTDVTCIGGVVHVAGPIDLLQLAGRRVTRVGPAPAKTRRASYLGYVGQVWGRGRELFWLTRDQLRRTRNGTAWRTMLTGTDVFGGVWDTGEVVWVTGWSGTVISIDRTGREREQWTGVDSVKAIWGAGETLWGVGAQGTVVKYAR